MANLTPNFYELSGHHLKVSYSTSGIAGKPTLNYQAGQQNLNFSGDQIRTLDTEIGTLVSVTILPSVDTGSTSFSMLIPVIVLPNIQTAENFETAGITTVHKTQLVLPATGVREIYTTQTLKGTARLVEFLAETGSGAASA